MIICLNKIKATPLKYTWIILHGRTNKKNCFQKFGNEENVYLTHTQLNISPSVIKTVCKISTNQIECSSFDLLFGYITILKLLRI